jgi:hypothetical protein
VPASRTFSSPGSSEQHPRSGNPTGIARSFQALADIAVKLSEKQSSTGVNHGIPCRFDNGGGERTAKNSQQ